ncbi:MAG: SUMF1/EgtB/PvdO family nonheme iron enzyme [Spirochaetales bacterium]|nr:SUMF1/EgtB/PvdO family nonheme iron enzyme [Spirochaetales bacterium]
MGKKFLFAIYLWFVVISVLSAENVVGEEVKMIRIPVPEEGIIFPVGDNDNGRVRIGYIYELGETPVTWRLWKVVYDWATSDERGANQYFFENLGRQGGNSDFQATYPVGTDLHPVTNLSWSDCIVWCNAMTEWHNAISGSKLQVVYLSNGSILRDSRKTNSKAYENAIASVGDGFRLPTSNEWELAARWRTDSINTVPGFSNPWFTKGDSASGAIANVEDDKATGLVYWFYGTSIPVETHPVGTKKPNSLGLYDMSGNVSELTFSRYINTGIKRPLFFCRGGGFYSGRDNLKIGKRESTVSIWDLGFRIARRPCPRSKSYYENIPKPLDALKK